MFEKTVILSRRVPPVLGAGALLKNSLCLIQGGKACVSADNGQLESAEAIENYERAAEKIITQAEEKPIAVAHDLHPDFPSTRFALGCGLKPVAVQHHHAHIAAVMAEHGTGGPVLGLALDGFGLGHNNESWGGELLRVDSRGFQRLGHIAPLPQPGGDIAARQPWRMGAAALWALGRGSEIAKRYADFPNARVLASMLEKGINSPPTTSAGRLFDAACGLLGVKPIAIFEGEAPMVLEAMTGKTETYSGGWTIEERNGLAVLNMFPLLEKLTYCETREGAELFHGTLISALADWTEKAAKRTGIKSVAIGGGCFLNKVLREGFGQRIMAAGLNLLFGKSFPPGDASVSLGQAWAAALMIENGAV